MRSFFRFSARALRGLANVADGIADASIRPLRRARVNQSQIAQGSTSVRRAFSIPEQELIAARSVLGTRNPTPSQINALRTRPPRNSPTFDVDMANHRAFVSAKTVLNGVRFPDGALNDDVLLRAVNNLTQGARLSRAQISKLREFLPTALHAGAIRRSLTPEALVDAIAAGNHSFLRRHVVQIAVFGAVMVVGAGLIVGMAVGLAEKAEKVRFNILSVEHVSTLDDITASLLDHFDRDKDLDDWDPEDPPKSTRTWTIVRIKYQDPSQLDLKMGHRVETRDTQTEPSIDGTRRWVLEVGDDTVDIAVPIRLSEKAGKGGYMIPIVNLDEELAEIVEMVEQAKDMKPGDRVDDDAIVLGETGGGGGSWRDNERLPLFIGLAGILVVVLIVVILASRRSSAPRTVAAPAAVAAPT